MEVTAGPVANSVSRNWLIHEPETSLGWSITKKKKKITLEQIAYRRVSFRETGWGHSPLPLI